MIWMTPGTLRTKPCPGCGKKGLSFAAHPHAFGYKDYSRVRCRYCKSTFKQVEKQKGKKKR